MTEAGLGSRWQPPARTQAAGSRKTARRIDHQGGFSGQAMDDRTHAPYSSSAPAPSPSPQTVYAINAMSPASSNPFSFCQWKRSSSLSRAFVQ